MYLLCVILIVLASVLMCGIVLIQNSKGGGLAAGFASSNQIMGVRKTTDFLEKATWSLAALMVVISVIAAYALPSETAIMDVNPTKIENTLDVPVVEAPVAEEVAQ
jgi:preprotein translocase subunit SecG